MAINNYNYLQEVRHIQELTKEIMRKDRFINYKQVWERLTAEKKFFKCYITFLNYMGVSNVNGKIEELERMLKKK